MAESPYSWTNLEKTIAKAMENFEKLPEDYYGDSIFAYIANALKAANLVTCRNVYDGWTLHGVLAHCPTCNEGLPIDEYMTDLMATIRSHRCKGSI